ncbi:redoxin domain-containing protein [Candidatus Sulfurimonas marisnigri]|uniref:Redoxin domain-containing protein n=1 Tax=Candidatus Sulfurimonas marisnigri TaxID=2740405 RepID=A0A7S7M124_9BACT|nr:redoxin domain-containing protein [Candidatus Sulfurimonas marisnigri]QOY55102.1 redoxin domain-containing protein [Candidatus Sulfurimonas marisnigri]
MKEKIKKYIKEILLFIVVITIFANLLSLYRSVDLNKQPLLLKTVTLLNSIDYTLKDDIPILVHFWATWCPVCKVEAGNIQRISESFQVITIALKSGSDAEIQDYLSLNHLNYKVINDSSGSITADFDVSIFPTTIIYDRNRKVLFSDVGYTSTFGLWIRMWWATYFN